MGVTVLHDVDAHPTSYGTLPSPKRTHGATDLRLFSSKIRVASGQTRHYQELVINKTLEAIADGKGRVLLTLAFRNIVIHT